MQTQTDPSRDAEGRKNYLRGTHRTISPEQTLQRVRPFLEAMGITRVANVTGLDRIGIPVVAVIRPDSRSVSVAQGKGWDLAAAKASGVMESIESWHAERITLPLLLGGESELRREYPLVTVADLPMPIGSRFDPGLPILWVQGTDLFSDRPAWLPYETVHTNFAAPAASGSGCFFQSSNGLASGNHIGEAVAHGLCEVVERDAISIWHGNIQRGEYGTRLDPDSVHDSQCLDVLEKLAAADMFVAVWDISTDVGVPTFYCVLLDERQPSNHFGIGAGCHPSTVIALQRALTEAVQVRSTYIAGARDDLSRDEFESETMAARLGALWDLARAPATVRNFGDMLTMNHLTIRQDIDWILMRLKRVGVEQAVAVDLSKAEFSIPVVRVVIPGLEAPHDQPGYRPGRRARRAMAA